MLRRFSALTALLGALLGSGCASEPWFESVLAPEDTYDPIGPYELEVYVRAPRGIHQVVMRVAESPGSDAFSDVRLTQAEGDQIAGRFVTELRGRPAPSRYELYFVVMDDAGAVATHPELAPAERLGFDILE